MHSQGYKRWGNRNPNNHRQLPRPQQTVATPPAPLQQGFGPPHPHFQGPPPGHRRILINQATGEVREGLTTSQFHPAPQPTRQFGFANNRPIVDPFGATPQQPSLLTPPPSEKERRFISIAEDDIASRSSSPAPEGGDNISVSSTPDRNLTPVTPGSAMATDINPKTGKVFTPAEWQNHLRIRDMRKVERKAKGNCKARQTTFQVERMIKSEDISDKERVEILTNNLRSKDHSIGQLRDINRGLTLERNKFERGLNNSNSGLATCRSDFAKCQEDFDKQRKGYEEAVRGIEEQLAQKQRNLASAQADSKEHSTCRGKLEDAEDRCSTVNAELDECKSQLKTSLQFKKLLEEADERCARLEKRNVELQKMATDNAKAIQLLTKRNSNQAKEVADLRKQLEEGTQVAKGLKKELDDHAESAKSRIQDLESQLTEQLNCMGAIEAVRNMGCSVDLSTYVHMITLPLFPLLLCTLSQIEFYMLFYHGSNSNCLETNLNTAQNQSILAVIDSIHVIRHIPHLRIKSSLCNTSIKSTVDLTALYYACRIKIIGIVG
ncbi:hypothetical protein DL95DRAFT_490350 [Leptodontidium sp. 2 PMI_412]|nr:hypothetical protein DL95DRAFT_490350 [Leptodontidium sp. 2 PMI_412]